MNYLRYFLIAVFIFTLSISFAQYEFSLGIGDIEILEGNMYTGDVVPEGTDLIKDKSITYSFKTLVTNDGDEDFPGTLFLSWHKDDENETFITDLDSHKELGEGVSVFLKREENDIQSPPGNYIIILKYIEDENTHNYVTIERRYVRVVPSNPDELVVLDISTDKDWDNLYYVGGDIKVVATTFGPANLYPTIDINVSSDLTNNSGETYKLSREGSSNTYSAKVPISNTLVKEVDGNNEAFYFETTNEYGTEFLGKYESNSKIKHWSIASGSGDFEEKIPPATFEYFKAGGYEKIKIRPINISFEGSEIVAFVKNQADNMIYTGHGQSCTAGVYVENGFKTPGKFASNWNIELKNVLIFGCAVFDIGDKNGGYPNEYCNLDNPNPGIEWTNAFKYKTVKTLLGFNDKAPLLYSGSNGVDQKGRVMVSNFGYNWLTLNQDPISAWKKTIEGWYANGSKRKGAIIELNNGSYCYNYWAVSDNNKYTPDCPKTAFHDEGIIHEGENISHEVVLSANAIVNASVMWPGSDIDIEITKPTGELLLPSEINVNSFKEEATFDYINFLCTIDGSWTFTVKGVEIEPEGEYYYFDILSNDASTEQNEMLKYNVPEDYATIQEAIDAAYSNSSGIVVVSEGVYKENLIIYNSVYVVSEKKNPLNTIIDGKGKQNTVVFNGCLNGGLIGFTIRNSGKNGNFAGVKIAGGEQAPIIANCIITDNGHGLFFQGNAQPFVINNAIAYNSGKGLRTGGNSPASIVNNIIAFNGGVEIERNGGHDFHMLSGNCVFDADNKLYDKIGVGVNDISQDPLFISETDLQLQSGSPCINACVDLNGQQTDIGALGSPEFDWIQAYQTELIVSTGNINSETTGVDIDLESRKKSGTEYTTMITKSGYIHEPTFTKLEDTKMYIISSSISESATMTFSNFEVFSVIYKLNESSGVWVLKSQSNSITANDFSGVWAVSGKMITTGIENKPSVLSPFKLFPNPTNGNLTVEYLNVSNSTTIRVFDLSGKLLINQKMNDQRMNVDLTKFGNQTFILQLKDGDNLVGSQKIIKK